MKVISIKTRNEFVNEIKNYFKLLVKGVNVKYTIDDIKAEYFKKYLKDLEYSKMPMRLREKTVKTFLNSDLDFAINEINK